MSSSGGIGGGAPSPQGAVQFGDAQIAANGSIQVKGENIDVSTVQGAAALMAAVDPQELAKIKAMLQLKEVNGPDGRILVADDSYRRVDTKALREQLGPLDTSQGASELDKELAKKVFVDNDVANPWNANTTPALYDKVGSTLEFKDAVSGLTNYLSNPTQGNSAKFAAYMQNVALKNPHGNIMEILFLVFRESIKEVNEDKKYFLIKLQEYNKMGENLSDYLSELVKASQDLGARAAGAKYPEMTLTKSRVSIKKFDLSTLGPDGNLNTLSTRNKKLDRAGLNDTIKMVESMQETVRNKRQMASTAFQNFDQKSNQLYNLLSSVMKAFNEMRMGTVRNML